jgi:exopolysaccharide biosynthesis protein
VGIEIREFEVNEPRPLRIHVAEINLHADGISFLVTPGNGDPNGSEPGDPNGETRRQTTLEFLEDQRAQLAINATFFGMGSLNTDNLGLVVSRGAPVSPFRGDWPAVNIDEQNRACVVRGDHDTYHVTSPSRGPTLYNAISGSGQIVTDGEATTDDRVFSTTTHPRTAIGYTADHKLILVAVDGRQPGVSEGMSLGELADFMIELRCVQALNLDGGGSTTMVVADPEPRVLNTPSSQDEAGEYGALRKNGTNLAVFARPNPDYRAPPPD